MGYRPGPELIHPRGTSLDDLKLHVALVSKSVGPADDILGCEVRGLDVTQGNLLVTEGQDALQMSLNAFGKLVIRFHPAPLELVHPLAKEPPGCPPAEFSIKIRKRIKNRGVKS